MSPQRKPAESVYDLQRNDIPAALEPSSGGEP